MARDQNTAAKRQREQHKKQKAADKRAKRQAKQQHTDKADPPAADEQVGLE